MFFPSLSLSRSWLESRWADFPAGRGIYGFEVVGLMLASGRAEEQCSFEVPWALVRQPELAVASGLPLCFSCDVDALRLLGLANLSLSLSRTYMHIHT